MEEVEEEFEEFREQNHRKEVRGVEGGERKTPSEESLSLSCQCRAFGVIRPSAADPPTPTLGWLWVKAGGVGWQDTDKSSRFLLPVRGRLQGKRPGCCGGRIRPQAGRKRRVQLDDLHSLHPAISLVPARDLLSTTTVLGGGGGWVSGGGFVALCFFI